MLPGFRRTQCAPASMRLQRERVVEVDVGDDGDRRLADDRPERLDVLLARHRHAHDVGARPRRRVRICSIVAGRFAVSVFVIVCTATGAPPPMGTPPTWICRSEAMSRSVRGPRWPAASARTSTAPRGAAAGAAGLRRPPARARPGATRRSSRLTGARPGSRIVDIGCGSLGLRALEPDLDVTGVDAAPRPGYPGPVRPGRRRRAPALRGRRLRPRVLQQRDRARRAGAARRASRPSCGASRAAGTSRRPRSRSRSSPTRCCPSRTGCPRACAAPTGGSASPAAGRRSICCAVRRSRPSSAPPCPSAPAHSSRAGSRRERSGEATIVRLATSRGEQR